MPRFESVISWFPFVLAIAVTLFAFSTSVTWYYYGERSFIFLIGYSRRVVLGYRVAFMGAIFVGSAMSLSQVINMADSFLLAMAVPNIVGLYLLAPKVKGMLASYMARLTSGEIAPVK